MNLLTLSRNIPDFRFDRKKAHSSEVIVYITLAAVICDAQTWQDIELFGHCKFSYFKKVFPYLQSIPSHDTFNRFFSLLKPEVFEKEFRLWVRSICSDYNGIIAIDGKTNRGGYYSEEEKNLRGTGYRAGSPQHRLHMVSAWAAGAHLCLGQVKVDDKSNEISAVPELLESLDVENTTITLDALNCQKKIAHTIIKNKADYVLAVKKNHKYQYESLVSFFENDHWKCEKPSRTDVFQTLEKGHGRIEERLCVVCDNIYWLDDYKLWDGLKSFAMLQTRRIVPGDKGPVSQMETRYYISSLKLNAQAIYKATRTHWAIENNLHWQLDVTFREDDDRKRNIAAYNFSLIAKVALALLKKDTTKKNSIRTKRKGAGWDNKYLHHLLNLIWEV